MTRMRYPKFTVLVVAPIGAIVGITDPGDWLEAIHSRRVIRAKTDHRCKVEIEIESSATRRARNAFIANIGYQPIHVIETDPSKSQPPQGGAS